MMTRITRIMYIVMMAFAVIMSLGTASAEAQVKKWYEEGKEWVEDPEGKRDELVDEKTKETFGVSWSEAMGFKNYWTEGDFLKVGNYHPDTYLFIGLLCLSCFFLYFRSLKKDDGHGIGLGIFLLSLVIILSWFFELLHLYPQLDEVRMGINSVLGLGCLVLVILRWKTWSDLRLAIKGGKQSFLYFLRYCTHPFRGQEDTSQETSDTKEPASAPEPQTVPETGQSATPGPPAEGQPAAAPAAAESPPRSGFQTKGLKCPSCGIPLRPKPGKFCTRCGRKLATDPVRPPARQTAAPAPTPDPAHEEEPVADNVMWDF